MVNFDVVKLREIAKDLFGVPFVHRGRERNGMDCVGLLIRVYKEFGVSLEEGGLEYSENWFRTPLTQLLEQCIRRYFVMRPGGFPLPGDLILWEYPASDVFGHCSIYIDEGDFLTTLKGPGVIVNSMGERFWRGRRHLIYRLA